MGEASGDVTERAIPAKPKATSLVSKREHHLWLMDVTQVKSFLGLIRRRIVTVIDAYTRAVIATSVCVSEPSADFMCSLLSRIIRDAKTKPVHLISDHGSQFTSLEFIRLLRRRGVRHRYGAIGKSGSIALIERWWRSLKREALDATSSWLTARALAEKVSRYSAWITSSRPHQGLQGRTAWDVPLERKCAKPLVITKDDVLVVTRRYLHDVPKLPVYSLRVRGAAQLRMFFGDVRQSPLKVRADHPLNLCANALSQPIRASRSSLGEYTPSL